MKDKFKIVDGHVHTFYSEEIADKIIGAFNSAYNIEFANPGNGTIPNVLENMKKGGIDYTIMANFAPAKILHNNNLWALEIGKEYKNLIPLVSFHPDMEGELLEYLILYIDKGAKGIKIHPMAQAFEPGHERMQKVYRYCNDIGFPVVYHCGRVSNARLNSYADLDMILPVIEKYKHMPIILTHMADGNVDDVLDLAGKYKNVYFDTSIVITGYPPLCHVNEPSWLDDETVIDVVEKIGAERILFGSDYPWGSPIHDVERFIKMALTDDQKMRILAKNALQLFKIEGHR